MLPKSSKHYIQPTADALELSYELVQDVVDFYYGELRKKLSNLEDPVVRVENLGIFKASDRKLKQFYVRYSRHLEIASTDTIKQMNTKKSAEKKLEKIKQIQDKIMIEKLRRVEFYNAKKNGKIKSDKK
jgi:hypothetical protein